MIAELEVYSFTIDELALAFSYQESKKQSVLAANNTNSKFITIVSGIPKGSILQPTFFNLSINYLFYFSFSLQLHR